MENISHEKQTIADGYGALFHRVYSISMKADAATARRAFADLKADMNRFSPQIIARFEKVRGVDERLQAGDEFQIHLSSPWDGPVRVSRVTDRGFRLETLENHIEAGFVEFRIIEKSPTEFVFEVESFAKSHTALIDFLYDKIPVARFAQTRMWETFCQNFAAHLAELTGLTHAAVSPVHVFTERRDEETGQWQPI